MQNAFSSICLEDLDINGHKNGMRDSGLPVVGFFVSGRTSIHTVECGCCYFINMDFTGSGCRSLSLDPPVIPYSTAGVGTVWECVKALRMAVKHFKKIVLLNSPGI